MGRVWVNGQEQVVQEGATVGELRALVQVPPSRILVQLGDPENRIPADREVLQDDEELAVIPRWRRGSGR